ncbi:MAG: class I SAM-dependent methyltransferase [Acidobacteriota bacterium]|nr:class I SAM-dependent methyltransferase [Acidobacteriota bacterium]
MSTSAAARYVMGHTDGERRRLALQASILEPFTEHLFRRAGITRGLHVLDIGCGVGDVSLLAARLVGRTGSVTSVDIDHHALDTLRQRAETEGHAHITTVHTDLHSFKPDRLFDAVVGRHILIHTPDPLSVLKDARELLAPRGLAAFQEFDFRLITPSFPEMPLRDRTLRIFDEFFTAAPAVHGDMGRRLFRLLLDAGFDHPECRGEFPVDGGTESNFHEWFAESARAILPRAEAAGCPTASGIDIDTLCERLREEARVTGGCAAGPVMFSCFARRL